MNFWIAAPLVFVVVAVADIMWALYVRWTAAGNAALAGAAAVGTWAFGAFVTWSWLHDPRLIPFALLGAFVGTFVAVKQGRK